MYIRYHSERALPRQTNDDANKMPDDPRRPLAKVAILAEGFKLGRDYPDPSPRKINMSPEKGDHFKRKFHLRTPKDPDI